MKNIIKVVGVTRENRQELLALLKNDPFVSLKEEPDNPVDPHAIKIVNRKGQTLGYVPMDYPDKDAMFRALGFCEFDVEVENLKDPTKWNAKGKKKYSWGLDIRWDYRLQKDGDYDDEPEVQSFFRDPIQKKHRSQDWKDVVKKNRKGRLTYQEIEAIKAAC